MIFSSVRLPPPRPKRACPNKSPPRARKSARREGGVATAATSRGGDGPSASEWAHGRRRAP
eukprot:SM006450S20484  [mRNA]  locus=s6450:174:400:+ [translate_table: standard]